MVNEKVEPLVSSGVFAETHCSNAVILILRKISMIEFPK